MLKNFVASITILLILCSCGNDNGSSVISLKENEDAEFDFIESSSSNKYSSNSKEKNSSSVGNSSSSAKSSDSEKKSSLFESSSSMGKKDDFSSSSFFSSSSVVKNDSSAEISDAETSSSLNECLSSTPDLSSSSEKKENISSSLAESSSATIPSKLYDCNVYKCITTQYLNPEIDYGEYLDVRDNQVYRTVVIGNQVWMAQNLNYADSVSTKSLKGRSWCYDNKKENCQIMGRLYSWSAAMDSVVLLESGYKCGYGAKYCTSLGVVQGICPSGWHLPSLEEFESLVLLRSGKKLKSLNGWLDYEGENGNGTDSFGFSGVPGGSRFFLSSGLFGELGSFAYFWSSTTYSEYGAYDMRLLSANDEAGVGADTKTSGLSVRCIKD